MNPEDDNCIPMVNREKFEKDHRELQIAMEEAKKVFGMTESKPANFYLWFQPKDGWQVTSFDPSGDRAIVGDRDVKVYVIKTAYDSIVQRYKEAENFIVNLKVEQEFFIFERDDYRRQAAENGDAYSRCKIDCDEANKIASYLNIEMAKLCAENKELWNDLKEVGVLRNKCAKLVDALNRINAQPRIHPLSTASSNIAAEALAELSKETT